MQAHTMDNNTKQIEELSKRLDQYDETVMILMKQYDEDQKRMEALSKRMDDMNAWMTCPHDQSLFQVVHASLCLIPNK